MHSQLLYAQTKKSPGIKSRATIKRIYQRRLLYLLFDITDSSHRRESFPEQEQPEFHQKPLFLQQA
jgi:hypothetical protein